MPYLSDGGLDALVLHQLRHHRPANDTNLQVSGKATHTSCIKSSIQRFGIP
jgi:hypothetical protein